MKQVLIKKGQAIIENIPAPAVEERKVLVETAYSCISIGTEMAGIRTGAQPLLVQAIQHPEYVMAVARMVLEQGLGKTTSVVRGVLESGNPIGYCAAGKVNRVGEGIADIRVGDRVACAGAGIANHAEILNVPRNLLVKIPESLGLREASTVTLGAIALQGIRRAIPTLGETFLVMGLGILGQLTVQMLRANGCRVIGLDPDRTRIDAAEDLGMDCFILPEDDCVTKVFQHTNGFGADGVIITAAAMSDEVVSLAFQSCRKKGRVVLVGDVGLHLKRGDFYAKEIDFLISTSYGPGRYEPNYEQKGLDYPIGYVRWTENRNMQEYLRLLAQGLINISPLINKEYALEDVPSAYAALKEGKERPLMVLLRYEAASGAEKIGTRVEVKPRWEGKDGALNVALVGGGDFAKAMHLPNLKKLGSAYSFYAVMSRTGTNAKTVARQFEAKYATTEYRDILSDAAVDLVFISTRHNLHAPVALEAVKAGKHVFVEKPMALNRTELASLASAITGKDISGESTNLASFLRTTGYEPRVIFMVGFNRRFSPFIQRVKELTTSRINPLIVSYRMNAGYIPLTHWVHGEEGGGRNIGEACHIYDLFNFLTGAEVEAVGAYTVAPATEQYARNDNFIATIKYKDGSLCNLIYTAFGAKNFPKEEMEIYVDGKIIKVSDYRRLEIYGSKTKGLETKLVEKGHLEELAAFAEAVKEKKEAIPFWQQVQATEISFDVERQL